MGKLLQLLFIILLSFYARGQTSYTCITNLTQGYVPCAPSGTLQGSCNINYTGGLLQFGIAGISNDTITFQVKRCSGNQFGSTDTFFLKQEGSSTGIDSYVVCGTPIPTNGISISGQTVFTYKYKANFTSGTKYFCAVVKLKNNNITYRFYSRVIGIAATQQPCPTPNHTQFTASNFTSTSFTAHWPAVSGATSYTVLHRTLTGTFGTYPPFTTSNTSVNITGLTPNTYYKFQVRAHCGSNNTSQWSPSSTNTFKTSTTSNYTFTIATPNGGQFFTTGTLQNISWGSTGLSSTDTVSLELCDTNGNPQFVIPQAGAIHVNTGSYSWYIPHSIPSGRYKIKIYKTGTVGGAYDTSDSPFTITNNSSTPTIAVTGPTLFQSYNLGGSLPITWTPSNISSSALIGFTLVNPSTKAAVYTIPPSTGVINNNSFTWNSISGVNAGSYQVKVYLISNPSIHAYSPTFNINSGSQAKSITVNYPNGGESLTTGQSINISWSSMNISPDPVSLELVQGNNTTAYQVIASPIQNQSPYSWTIPSNILTGQYRLKIYRTSKINGTIVDYSNNNFTITNTTVPSCIIWASGIQPNSFEKKIAAEYLCSQSIIQNTQNAGNNDQPIQRHDLAKILFKGLFGAGSSVATPVDYAQTPFYDIQNNTYYSQFVKALCYLEYNDGVPVFNRDFTHFRPSEKIKRKDAVKAFVEAWNISVNRNPVGSSVFLDVPITDPAYPWIKTAKDAGLINGNSNGSFYPEQYITRSDAFIILWRLLTNSTITKPTPTANDFFFSNNVTPLNWNKSLSIANANFDYYAKNSFSIDGIVPLSFTHFYSSVATELPDELYEKYNYDSSTIRYKMLPLGKGWSHSYNAYLLKVDGDTAGSLTDDRYIIHWSDGTFDSYKLTSSNTFISETIGNYDTLYINNGALEVKKKDQTRYRFTYAGNNKVFTLSEVIDRNSNKLTLQWSLHNNSPRLDRVVASSNRYLQFYYNKTDENLITAVSAYTGSIVRTVYFEYSQDNKNLVSYKDAKNQSTIYTYGTTNKERHLLKTITLPKGNVITNTYEQRKLTSTQYNSQYKTQVGFTANYSSSNPTFKTSVTTFNSPTGTSNPHQSHYTFNGLGNITTFATALDSIGANYTITGQPNLPSSITDYVSGIQTTINYNSKGNVTQTQRNAPGLPAQIIKLHYNSLNDVDTVTDTKGNKTVYVYNTAGNLTNINQPNNVITTITPNSNGTTSSIVNPSGITTKFNYNQYGNVIYANTDGTSISAAATYDDASRLLTVTDPNNVLTKVTYDNNDNVISVKEDANNTGFTTSYNYDANGNTVKIIPPLGQPTILDYDNNNLLINETFGPYSKQLAYNDDGTPKTFKNKNGHVFNYSFYPSGNTHAGQLQTDGYAEFGYDTRHNLHTITHKGNNKVITIGYDAFNRPDSVHYNDATSSNTIKYYYNTNNLDSAIVYPTVNLTVFYNYDANNRLTTVKDGNSYTFVTYTYLADDRLDTETFGNGTKTVYKYESNTGRLDSMVSLTSSNSVIIAYKFKKDNSGNHTEEKPNIPNGLTTPPPNTANISYQHNSIDRQTKFDTLNQGFNNNGAQTTLQGQPWASYDERDNLTSYKHGSSTDTFEYDGLEGRRQKNNTRYVLDVLHNNNVLLEAVNGHDSSIYIYGLGLICRIDATSSTNKSYYHYDYRGSTIAITNSSQAVTHRYKYSAYGILEARQENGFTNPYRYVGKHGVQYDDSALYFMRVRYYNPYQARFLSEDPIWHTNLFAYAGNNPIMNIDADGMSWAAVDMATSVWYLGNAWEQWYEAKVYTDLAEQEIKNGNPYTAAILAEEALKLSSTSKSNLSNSLITAGTMAYLPGAGTAGKIKAVGQEHHLLSKKIMNVLNEHPTLKGILSREDPTFKYNALNNAAHNGYQKWHRMYDKVVTQWLNSNLSASKSEFINFLHNLHQQSWLKSKIPNVNLLK